MPQMTSRFDKCSRAITGELGAVDYRGDAVAASVWFTRQLEDIDGLVSDVKYADLKALQFVQLKPGLDPLAERYTRRVRDMFGSKSKRSSHPTDTAPLAQVSRKEESVEYFVYKQGFGYSRDEIMKGARFGVPLDKERAESSRKLQAQSLDALVATGDAEVSVPGLLTLSGTDTYTPSGGSAPAKLWTAKTADQILGDLNGLVTQVRSNTKSIEAVKRIVLPTTLMRILETTARSTTSDLTLKEYFLRNNPGIVLDEWERLSDSTTDLYGNSCNGTSIGSGLNRVLAGDFSLEVVAALVPLMNEMLEPERQGEGWKIDLKMKFGGIDVLRPKAIIYADGM